MVMRANPLRTSALSLLLAAACSNEVQPRGQLMLAISSDMSVTKDMDEVHVEVWRADGTRLPDREIPILPSQPAPFGKPLPGTLAIVPSDAGGQSLFVRLAARHLNAATGIVESRVVREAIVKVPTDRVAMLRMPLRWLCDGQVEPDGNGFRSACPNEQTCVAGVCKPADIDVNSLPDYLNSEVYGGGTPSGKGSQCLDVQSCFAQTIAQAPDQDCTVPLPAGANPARMNVALVLPPESDGHCLDDPDKGPGKGSCLMPLDNDEQEGFVIDGNRIRLPPAACLRTNVVGIAVSLACNTKDLSIPVCGPWNGWAAQPEADGSGGTNGMAASGGTTASAGAFVGTGAESSGGASTDNAGGQGPLGRAGGFSSGGFGASVGGASASEGGEGSVAEAGAATGGDAGSSTAGAGAECTGTNGCYRCVANSSSELLNHCTDAVCVGFSDTAAHVPFPLPPLPTSSQP